MTPTTRYTKPKSIVDRSAFLFYRERMPNHRLQKVNRELYPKIVTAIFEEIGNGLVEKDAGVLIPGLGLFTLFMRPHKTSVYMMNGQTSIKTYNLHSESYTYHPVLFTDVFEKNKIEYFVIDRTVKENIKKRLADKIRAGKKYKLLYTQIKQLYKQKKTHEHKSSNS